MSLPCNVCCVLCHCMRNIELLYFNLSGEAWRVFHRTKHYDGMLSAFIQAGIKVLFSACQVETADLLKELALVEQRKNAAIHVPTEVEGPRQDVFRFYLTIPCVSYTLALALCHHFGSLKELANRYSSPLVVLILTLCWI